MSDETKGRLSIGVIVAIVGIVGPLCGGFIAAKTMGESEGTLRTTVETHSREIESLVAASREDRLFRERVLSHMATQDERWAQIQRVIYRGTAPVER